MNLPYLRLVLALLCTATVFGGQGATPLVPGCSVTGTVLQSVVVNGTPSIRMLALCSVVRSHATRRGTF